jgi:hypothetical protein
MIFHAYQVGKPYTPGRRNWPENVEYNYRQHTHELRMFLGNLKPWEIEAIKTGPCEFALVVDGDVLFLLYHFGEGRREAVPWSDAPYSWYLVPEDQRGLPEPAGMPEPHDTMQIVLVDSLTGIIKALRMVSFSPAFTVAIRSALRDQAERPWPGGAEYDRQLAAVYQRYTSEQLLARAVARTTGGA